MLEFENETFELQDVKFRFKDSSPKNTDRVFEYMQELQEEFGDVESPEEISERADIKSMKEMVKLMSNPTDFESHEEAFEEIEWPEVNMKEVRYYMEHFLS